MELIDKNALVAEIERRQKIHFNDYHINGNNSPADYGACNALTQILAFINTLEVKEVDLDFQTFAKEMDAVFSLPSSETENTEENPLNWEFAIAKHFFELGLKAQKGG